MELTLTNILMALVVLSLIGLQASAMIFAYLLLKRLDQGEPKIFLSTATTTNSTPAVMVAQAQRAVAPIRKRPQHEAMDDEYLPAASPVPARIPNAECGHCQSPIYDEPVRAMLEKGKKQLVYRCYNCNKEVAVQVSGPVALSE